MVGEYGPLDLFWKGLSAHGFTQVPTFYSLVHYKKSRLEYNQCVENAGVAFV